MPQEPDLYSCYADESDGAGARLFVKKHVIPVIGPERGRPILELGAGTGETVRALSEMGYSDVRGVDASESQVRRARKRGSAVAHADGLAALEACRPRSLGAVLVLDVLEHLEIDQRIAWGRAASARLRDDGVFLARTPNGAGLFGGSLRYGDLTHVGVMTENSARQLMTLAGFEEVRVMPCRPLGHGVVSGLRLALWRGVELGLRIADAAESGRTDGIFTRNLIIIARRPRRGEP